MSRPTGFADLAGQRVGIFGYGVEGRATRRRLEDLAGSFVLVDDAADVDPAVIETQHGGLEALLACDVVLKSPGVPRRRADVVNLETHGVTVTSSLNLWLHDIDRRRVVGITGTKGKSTTTALTAFFLQSLGEAAQRLGNIGTPPYDPDLDVSSGWLVLEVSSFQCVDLEVAPRVVVVTSLGEDHLDWHGSVADYQRDKLSLTRTDGAHLTLVPDTPQFRALEADLGGDVTYVAPDTSGLATLLGLMGEHSNSNVALALATVASLTGRGVDEVRERLRGAAENFVPLRGRLTLVERDVSNGEEVRYVDDGLATSVLPAIAALEVFADVAVALIAGGFDRGVDYAPLATALARRNPFTVLITLGDAGQRIADEVVRLDSDVVHLPATSMREAVVAARTALSHGGVVLLSPGAPSFDAYKNWEERSEAFTNIVREELRKNGSLGGDSNS